ncbi:MAG TPA: amidohydrolase family protein, partial [Actinomycetota bacterium]|nr:amidohydrolase family protein [Actinomycetota bacterium]
MTLSHPTMGEWILVDQRHVERVGVGDPPEADATIDLPGATIVPGFIDSHVHLTATGRSLMNEDVRDARSKDDLLEVVRARAEAGGTVVHVEGFDETRWDRPVLPTAAELDAITPLPVVAVRADGHLAVLSSSALGAVDAGDAAGIERGPDGAPTGRITQEANRLAAAWIESTYDRHRIEELQLQAAGLAASRGVTTVHEMSMDGKDLQVLLGHHGQLPIDVRAIPATTSLMDAMAMRLEAVGGDLPVDGSIAA